jgi:hypothetical protein
MLSPLVALSSWALGAPSPTAVAAVNVDITNVTHILNP